MGKKSRILFFSPRLHPNLISNLDMLYEKKHEIQFISYIRGDFSYSKVNSDFLGMSFLSIILLLLRKSKLLSHRKYNYYLRKYGGNNIFLIFYKILKFNPNLIITRDRNFQTIIITLIGKILSKKVILYVQARDFTFNRNLRNRILNSITPKIVVNPLINKPSHHVFLPLSVSMSVEPNYLKQSNDIIRILMVGKYTLKRKNHFTLLKAFKNLSENYANIKLMIVGTGNEDNPTYLNLTQYIIENELEESVELKNNISYTAMHKVYRNCNIFVLPSFREPFGYSLLEAMANGLAVISTNDSGSASYIKHGHNGYVFSPHNQKELEELLGQLISNPEKIRNYGKKAYDHIKAVASKDAFYTRFIQLERDTLSIN